MTYDAIVIPGAGVRAGRELPPWVSRRMDRVLEVQSGEPIVLLSGGTVHKPPPLDPNGFPIFESHAGAKYLLDRGIPKSQILTEIMSWETIGNAYFAKIIHIDPMEARRLLVVNSEFHAKRCETIFRWVFGLDAGRSYEWTFEVVPDRDTMRVQAWEARTAKERAGLDKLHPLLTRFSDLGGFRQWLLSEFPVYAGAPEFHPALDAATLESY